MVLSSEIKTHDSEETELEDVSAHKFGLDDVFAFKFGDVFAAKKDNATGQATYLKQKKEEKKQEQDGRRNNEHLPKETFGN